MPPCPRLLSLALTKMSLRFLHLLKAIIGGAGNTFLCSSEWLSIDWSFPAAFPNPLSAGWYVSTNGTLPPSLGLWFYYQKFQEESPYLTSSFFEDEEGELAGWLKGRGYEESLVDEQMDKARMLDRANLFKNFFYSKQPRKS